MRYYILLIAFLFANLNLFANLHDDNKHLVLAGQIIDIETKKPLPGVRIEVINSKLGAISDIDGKYKIEFHEKGIYEIKFNFIGYNLNTLKVNLENDLFENIELISKPIQLNQVNISANRIEQSKEIKNISIINSEDIHKNLGQTFSESIKNIPGVSIMQTGPSIAKPVIRGMQSDRLVLVNSDVNQEGQQWGGEHAPEIDPFSSSSIEIIKGAAGLEYGPHAIGGVIKVSNAEITETDNINGNASIAAFSNNRQIAGSLGLFGKTYLLDNLLWRAHISYRKAGDSKTPDYSITNSAFNELSYSGELTYKRTSEELNFMYSHFGTELGIFKGAHIHNLVDLQKAMNSDKPLIIEDFSYNINKPKQDITHDIFKIKGKYSTRLFDYESVYALQINHRQEYDSHTRYNPQAINFPSIDLTLYTHSFDLKAKHYPGKNIIAIIGLNLVRQGNIKEGNVNIIPNYRSYTGGTYSIIKLIKDKYSLETGLRYDYIWTETYRKINNVENDNIFEYQNISFSIGGNYEISDGWNLSSNISTAWRPPNLNELFSNDVHHGTARFEIGDIKLNAERNINTDINFNYNSEFINLQTGIYANYINNYIYSQPLKEPILTIRGAFPAFKFMQTNALISGIDGFFQFYTSHHHFAKLTYSYIYAEDLSANEPLVYMPPLSLSLINHFHIDDIGFMKDNFIELDTKYSAKQTRVPENSDYMEPPGEYFLLNLNIGTNLQFGNQDFKLNLSANNLLNRRYRDYMSRFRYFIDEPGLNIILRIFIPIN